MPSGSNDKSPKTITGGRAVGRVEADPRGALHEFTHDNFYVSGTDKDGRESKVKLSEKRRETIGVPPWVSAQMQELVDDDGTPYRHKYDLIRDALVCRIHYLQERRTNKKLESYEHFLQMAAIEREVSEAHRQHEQVTRLREILSDAGGAKDRHLIDEALARCEKMLPTMREPYRSDLGRLVEEYQGVIIAPPRANWSDE